jgi:hypothetical protein
LRCPDGPPSRRSVSRPPDLIEDQAHQRLGPADVDGGMTRYSETGRSASTEIQTDVKPNNYWELAEAPPLRLLSHVIFTLGGI